MSFAAGLARGVASGKNAADARRDRESLRALAEDRLAREEAAGRSPMRPAEDWRAPMGGNPAPAGPAPALPDPDAGDPRRGTMATGAGRPGYVPQDPLRSLIDRHEGAGRYDTLLGHAQRPGGDDGLDGVDVSTMTIGQLGEFTRPSGRYGQWSRGQVGRVATPMGRFQIVGRTLRNTAREMGLSEDTVFSPAVQESMFEHLAARRLAGAHTMNDKMAALRSEWEGFRHVPDADLARAITQIEQRGRSPARLTG